MSQIFVAKPAAAFAKGRLLLAGAGLFVLWSVAYPIDSAVVAEGVVIKIS